MVQLMVQNPDDVHVVVTASGMNVDARVQVNPSDLGTVLGKNGRTIRAIRVITLSMTQKAKVSLSFDVGSPGDKRVKRLIRVEHRPAKDGDLNGAHTARSLPHKSYTVSNPEGQRLFCK